MMPLPERSLDELNEALHNRLEMLVTDLLTISGMTKRGATLDPRQSGLDAIRCFANRIFEALEKREPAKHPWDVAND